MAEKKKEKKTGLLDSVDPDVADGDEDNTQRLKELREALSPLQRLLRQQKVATIILIEGWDRSGTSVACNEILRGLDPRGYDLRTIVHPTEIEAKMPFFWRFWIQISARGRVAVFDRGWYTRLFYEGVYNKKKGSRREYINEDAVNRFERTLADDGYLIIKLFFHISKKEQKSRAKGSETFPCAEFLLHNEWQPKRDYDRYYPLISSFLARTDTEAAPWIVIPADDRKYAIRMALERVHELMATRAGSLSFPPNPDLMDLPHPVSQGLLQQAEVNRHLLERKEYRQLKEEYGRRIRDLQAEIYRKRIPVIIVFEGWDASGKGGAILRLSRYLNPLGYRIIPVGVPAGEEAEKHYFWRFIRHMPRPGHIAIFDRSWYGRVMVERVEGLADEKSWRRAYQEITNIEEGIARHGAEIIKFWLHIDSDEQLRRFEERQNNPEKNWKITDEDWRNRSKRAEYLVAVEEMLAGTGTELCPWTVVEANNKYYARIKILQTIAKRFEERVNES